MYASKLELQLYDKTQEGLARFALLWVVLALFVRSLFLRVCRRFIVEYTGVFLCL
jgi:hypothetical protein